MEGSTLFILILALLPILIAQGLWMFQDAKKQGEKYYWLWGLFGILNVPGNLIIYLIVTRIIKKKNSGEGSP